MTGGRDRYETDHPNGRGFSAHVGARRIQIENLAERAVPEPPLGLYALTG
jgi:hypothetical protein